MSDHTRRRSLRSRMRTAAGGGGRAELPGVRLPAFVGSRLEAHPSFTRGLSLGLLVGAAVAGSTIWGRLRGDGPASPRPAARQPDARSEPGPPTG